MAKKPLFTEQEIKTRVKQLAEKITNDYCNKDLLVIGVLKGACIFFSDLIRLIEVPLVVDFIIASSYIKNESSGEMKIHYNMRDSVKGKDVLIIEDIIDTGFTINYITNEIAKENPNSLKVCTLLNKKARRQVKVSIDYTGFEVPDLFLIGYGLDYENQFRNIPYITVYENKT